MSFEALYQLQDRAKKARDEAALKVQKARAQHKELEEKAMTIDEQLKRAHPQMMSGAALHMYSQWRAGLERLKVSAQAALAQSQKEIDARQSELTTAGINHAKYGKLIEKKLAVKEAKAAKAEQRMFDEMSSQIVQRQKVAEEQAKVHAQKQALERGEVDAPASLH